MPPAPISRRGFLRDIGLKAGAAVVFPRLSRASVAVLETFAQRGYYITFMRMPTYGLPQWKQIIDCIHSDRGNLLLLWMGGGFRSKKFPITWKFNEGHANVRHDFVRELIDYARKKKIRVLLGFTPFGYDGVNQMPIEKPELKAVKRDGGPTDKFGIYCWGWNLCPSRAESQAFMREYVREMFFDFYPNADGLMIESSDYAICHCPDCGAGFFEKEFQFVRGISEEVWRKKPDAQIVVYPHYFSGTEVPGFNVHAATLPFDPRWTLCFTPHSAHPDSKLIAQAKSSLWSDDAPALHDVAAVYDGVRRARHAKVTGYIPSLEAFTYIATQPEEGQNYLVGKRQVPLGFGWLKEDEIPYNEMPIRMNRIAYREGCREPGIAFDDLKKRLERELFGKHPARGMIEDALKLQQVFTHEHSWSQPPPLVNPERVRERKQRGALKPAQTSEYRATLERVREIATRYESSANPGAKEMGRIASWILSQWAGTNAELLKAGTGDSGE